MTRAEKLNAVWRDTDKDYRSVTNGERRILVLRQGSTQLVPLTCLTDEEIERRLPKPKEVS